MAPKLQIASSDYWKLSDEELIRHFRETNEYTYIKYIFQRYGHIVFGICLRQLQDVNAAKKKMEDIFIQMLAIFKEQSIKEFKPWLFKYLHHSDGQKINPETPESENESILSNHNDSNIDFAWENENIESALSHLSDKQKLCIRLFYQENKTCAEIAAETGHTIAQVKDWLCAGRKNIASNLEMRYHAH